MACRDRRRRRGGGSRGAAGGSGDGLELIVLDGDARTERCLQRLDVGGGDGRPAHGIEEGGQFLGGVQAVLVDLRQRATREDPAARLDLPDDLEHVAVLALRRSEHDQSAASAASTSLTIHFWPRTETASRSLVLLLLWLSCPPCREDARGYDLVAPDLIPDPGLNGQAVFACVERLRRVSRRRRCRVQPLRTTVACLNVRSRSCVHAAPCRGRLIEPSACPQRGYENPLSLRSRSQGAPACRVPSPPSALGRSRSSVSMQSLDAHCSDTASARARLSLLSC